MILTQGMGRERKETWEVRREQKFSCTRIQTHTLLHILSHTCTRRHWNVILPSTPAPQRASLHTTTPANKTSTQSLILLMVIRYTLYYCNFDLWFSSPPIQLDFFCWQTRRTSFCTVIGYTKTLNVVCPDLICHFRNGLVCFGSMCLVDWLSAVSFVGHFVCCDLNRAVKCWEFSWSNLFLDCPLQVSHRSMFIHNQERSLV